MLGQFGQVLAMALGGSDDFHLVPVVRKFLAAIETGDVGPGQSGGLGAARTAATNGDGKAVTGMSATENGVIQSGDHDLHLPLPDLRPDPGIEIAPSLQ